MLEFAMRFYNRSSINKQAGVTILEVLIAVVIFSFGMLALSRMQMQTIYDNQVGKQKVAAMLIAQEYLEKSLLTPFNKIDQWHQFEKDILIHKSRYHLLLSVNQDVIPSVKRISVVVSWGKYNVRYQTTKSQYSF